MYTYHMKLLENVDLARYTTMRLGGTARYVTEITSRGDLQVAVAWAAERQLEVLMVGGGSNIFWRDEGFAGLLLINQISGYEDIAENKINHYLTVGAGENWDSVVARSVLAGLSGIETLSLIPGTTGGTPIQNVGAYGQDIATVLVSLEAYDLKTHGFVIIPMSDCGFGYRTSRFKTADRGRFLICSITLHLTTEQPRPPFYQALADYFEQHAITEYNSQILRDAVIDIRSHKLPDPAVIANNGSFFANPIIGASLLAKLQVTYPAIPHWPNNDGTEKIPAAWLIEQAGFKDFHDNGLGGTGMATWAAQPLVLINEQASSTADLLKFKCMIVDAVQARFNVMLVQEPEMLPLLTSGSPIYSA